MKLTTRVRAIMGLVVIVAAVGASVALASGSGSSDGVPGQIDDGAELLDQASITLEEAIRAAQGAYEGALGEIDLELYEGALVFNVDIGALDVKVDASTGAVLAGVADDDGDSDSDSASDGESDDGESDDGGSGDDDSSSGASDDSDEN